MKKLQPALMQIMQAVIVYSEVANILIKGTRYVVICQHGENWNEWDHDSFARTTRVRLAAVRNKIFGIS